MLSGTIALHDRDSEKTLVMHQGQAFEESVHTVHRGESADETVVLVVTYAGTQVFQRRFPRRVRKKNIESDYSVRGVHQRDTSP